MYKRILAFINKIERHIRIERHIKIEKHIKIDGHTKIERHIKNKIVKQSIIKDLFPIKKVIFSGILLSTIALVACQNNSIPSDVEVSPTEVVSPTTTPSATATPTLSPTPTVSTDPIEDESLLTEEEARSLIEERLDLSVYSVSLLSEDITVEDNRYYSFIVKDKNVVIEPALVVDKVSGEVSCFSADGTITDYSNFPLYNPLYDAVCDWNGQFRRHNALGEMDGKLILAQGDPNSFEFSISVSNKLNIGHLSGIATIQGNTATFTDEDGFTLNFTMNENELTLLESGENPYVGANVRFDGTYTLNEEGDKKGDTISSDQALDLLKSLTKEQTNLPADISEYTLNIDNMLLTIKDTVCYSIGVYSDLGDRLYLMNSYFVATDGSKIYTFDVTKGDDVVIYSAE